MSNYGLFRGTSTGVINRVSNATTTSTKASDSKGMVLGKDAAAKTAVDATKREIETTTKRHIVAGNRVVVKRYAVK